METKIIKVTDKGQISIPITIRNSIGINPGDELIAVENKDTIFLKKIKRDDFSDLLKHSEDIARKLWDNKEDEIWDTI